MEEGNETSKTDTAECNGSHTGPHPFQFTPGLYLPWYRAFPFAEHAWKETLIRHILSTVYVSCACFHAMFENNLLLLFVKTAFKFSSGVCFEFHSFQIQ